MAVSVSSNLNYLLGGFVVVSNFLFEFNSNWVDSNGAPSVLRGVKKTKKQKKQNKK